MGTVLRVNSAEPSGTLLERVRKLLAMAEGDGVTTAEAEAFTEKAAGLMARYGIDRALLAAARPDTDRPDNRLIDVPNPWADVRAHLLAGLVAAMRCQCVLLPARSGKRVHVFGYQSDLERAEMLYTSLLVQMAHGLARAPVPATARSVRAWRRSWLLGYTSAVIGRVRAAEERAVSDTDRRGTGTAHQRRWSWPTARWWFAGTARRPTRSPASCGSPTPGAATARATRRASAPTSAGSACVPAAAR